MKKLLISILLSLLSLLFIFVSCTSQGGVLPQGTTAGEVPAGSDISPDETTADIESTSEEKTTKEETTAEETEPIPSSVKESIEFRWYYSNADFFDYLMLYRAKDEDFDKLQEGMTYSEVIEIVGRPHGMWGSGNYRPYWLSLEGYEYTMYFEDPHDENGEYIITHSIYEYADLTTFLFFDKYGRYNASSPKPHYVGTDDRAARCEDPRLKELPSYNDMMNLSKDLTFKEVVELYGKPQYYGTTTIDGKYKYIWVFYTAEGIEVGVEFLSAKTWDDCLVNYIISLDPQNYIPGRDSFETVIVTKAPSTNTATPETTREKSPETTPEPYVETTVPVP